MTHAAIESVVECANWADGSAAAGSPARHPGRAASTDVPIHITTGCGICGSAEPHTHPYGEWKAALDAAAEVTR